MKTPIAFVDVHYEGERARAACVVARAWTDATPIEERVATLAPVSAYRPGAFFERELPCILEVLARLASTPEIVVVDGYVVLDADGTPGLGAHLHARLGGRVAVVGVAKTAFRGSDFATPVLRGTSARPLYVTSRGIDVAEAARALERMHGVHRIPTLLGRVDRLARGQAPSSKSNS